MIKVTVGEQKTQSEYPKLMIRKDQELIIAFTSNGKGVVLSSGTSPYSDYELVTNLGMEWFEYLTAPITLQNA